MEKQEEIFSGEEFNENKQESEKDLESGEDKKKSGKKMFYVGKNRSFSREGEERKKE